MLYQDESLGREISFQVQRLEMWSRQPQELQPALTGSSSTKQGIHDIDRYLNRFWLVHSECFYYSLKKCNYIVSGRVEKILPEIRIPIIGITLCSLQDWIFLLSVVME